ncbi:MULTISPECIES: hypothetical protein [unclassified Allomuricauda]|uniref:hypothetical protein n=1 Tax=unclassified Allomuricauda TaxID=2615049 RepID=UPI00273EBAB3|nr:MULTISPECIES: hypothetical protein [unclassified Allomuricauda]
MSTITITNNTKLPIHAGTQWNHIVQEFKNNILPGATIDLPSADFGWQDLMVVTGFKDNEISHAQDWSKALGFGVFIAGALGTIASTALTVVTAGGATPLLVASVAATAASVTALETEVLLTINDFIVHPATVPALWGPDGYNITVSGGDVSGEVNPATGEFTVKEVSPLQVQWTNKTSGTTGIVGSTR